MGRWSQGQRPRRLERAPTGRALPGTHVVPHRVIERRGRRRSRGRVRDRTRRRDRGDVRRHFRPRYRSRGRALEPRRGHHRPGLRPRLACCGGGQCAGPQVLREVRLGERRLKRLQHRDVDRHVRGADPALREARALSEPVDSLGFDTPSSLGLLNHRDGTRRRRALVRLPDDRELGLRRGCRRPRGRVTRSRPACGSG